MLSALKKTDSTNSSCYNFYTIQSVPQQIPDFLSVLDPSMAQCRQGMASRSESNNAPLLPFGSGCGQLNAQPVARRAAKPPARRARP